MTDDQPGTMRLVPFLEPENPDYPHQDRFVAGFKDADGERWGVVPLERRVLKRAVLLSTTFKPHVASDGTVQPWPDDSDDDVFGEMLKLGLLEKIGLDDLIAENLKLDCNEPDHGEDGVLPEYAVLRDRLKRAMFLVEAEIARRELRNPKGA
jgi:hypothetical protein